MKLILSILAVTTLTACVLVPVPRGSGGSSAGKSVVVCHKGKKTMELPAEAAQAHIDHGDYMGACR